MVTKEKKEWQHWTVMKLKWWTVMKERRGLPWTVMRERRGHPWTVMKERNGQPSTVMNDKTRKLSSFEKKSQYRWYDYNNYILKLVCFYTTKINNLNLITTKINWNLFPWFFGNTFFFLDETYIVKNKRI